MIPALILAAGAGRRMGGPKALLVIEGETLLHRTVRVARSVGCHPVIAVVGDWASGPLDPGATLVHNPGAAEGMASSIRLGVAALPPDAKTVLILTVDQPAVTGDVLERLLALAAKNPAQPAACAYGGSLGIPAVLPQRLFKELLGLRGDRGAKAILLRENTALLPFLEGGSDLDTPEDLARLRR
jgi:CTP:molybdopterin cytidylyltransferase MocA